MRVIFQSPITKIWYCIYSNHIECTDTQIFVQDGESGNMILAYQGEDAFETFEHFIEYGRIFKCE